LFFAGLFLAVPITEAYVSQYTKCNDQMGLFENNKAKITVCKTRMSVDDEWGAEEVRNIKVNPVREE
jgi:hypothetical protein